MVNIYFCEIHNCHVRQHFIYKSSLKVSITDAYLQSELEFQSCISADLQLLIKFTLLQ